MEKNTKNKRLNDFRKRADYSPESVYIHDGFGWEYIPIHPFGDEEDILKELNIINTSCKNVDGWCLMNNDATLLETCVLSETTLDEGLYVKANNKWDERLYLVAVFDAPYVTRTLFEYAMEKFVDSGFPTKNVYNVRWSDGVVKVNSFES